MRYLGGLRGSGILKSGDDATGIRTAYDFDSFLRANNQVVNCGEIRMSSAALRKVFGRTDLRLETQDGRILCISFSDKKIGQTDDAAPVDVTSGLSEVFSWRPNEAPVTRSWTRTKRS